MMNDLVTLASQLRVTLGKLEMALGAVADAIAWTDLEGYVQWCNTSFDRLVGRSHLEILGAPLSDLLPLEQEGRALPLRETLRDIVLKKQGNFRGICDLPQEKGRRTVEVAAVSVEFNQHAASVVIVVQDISERKQLQTELIQAEKMAALGRFSSGVAHEVKNPLGIILSGVEFLERRALNGDPDVRECLTMMKSSTLRANRVVQGLMKFARPSPMSLQRAKAEELIEEMLGLVKYQAQLKNIAIETHYAPDLWLEVDRNQIQQALFNIVSNAFDALEGQGGRIAIHTSTRGSHCAIEVSDTGCGISQENLPRLFEPFFTTKRDRKGTGLGLSIVEMIVENHRGQLQVESTLGKGTTCWIFLPLASKLALKEGI